MPAGPVGLHRRAGLPVQASPRGGGAPSWIRPVVGLVNVAAIVGLVAGAVILFRGGATQSVPVTVMSPRAGLVMNPDAKVKLHDLQVGKVESIEELPDGQAAIHLSMDSSRLQLIPANVLVNVASSTVFGAKFVELVEPPDPSPQTVQAGQVLDAEHVTVEINTIFDQLVSVLSTIEPQKLNETLGAMASALDGRGEKIGETLADLDHLLATMEPSLGNLSHEFSTAPEVLRAYADTAPDLLATLDNTTQIGNTFIDEQQNLDALLVGAIGLADVGTEVVGGNRDALTEVLHLMVPTTDLTNKYNAALTCALAGIVPLAKSPPGPYPGITTLASFLWGSERYRYPGDLPKVAATGGPHCTDMHLPVVPFETRPPFLIADVGANPWQYGNQGVLLNSEGLKNLLFGPLDGPPRNTLQIGQPG